MTEPAPYSSVDLSLIKQILPHRYPFLMIDKVRDIVPFEGGVGIKMVTSNEPHFQGHFPEEPVMPGVLIVEAMAQTAAIVVGVSTNIIGGDMLTYFMGIDSCKFRRKVVPGDILELNVKCLRPGGKVWKFRGEATVDGELAAGAEFMAMMAPKPKG